MSRSCYTERLGSLASSRMIAGREGLPLGDGVGRRIRSCHLGGFGRWNLASGQQQAAQEEWEEHGRDVMASFTSGSRRGGAGVVSVGSPSGSTPRVIRGGMGLQDLRHERNAQRRLLRETEAERGWCRQ